MLFLKQFTQLTFFFSDHFIALFMVLSPPIKVKLSKQNTRVPVKGFLIPIMNTYASNPLYKTQNKAYKCTVGV